jgi:hypothetical protein
MENKIWHFFDGGLTGRVLFTQHNSYLTGFNNNKNLNSHSDSSVAGDTIFVAPADYNITASVSKNLVLKTLPGVIFDNININNDTLRVTGPLKINTELNLTSSYGSNASLVTTDTVTIGSQATYLETGSQYVIGKMKATRTVGAAAENFGGIGFGLGAKVGRNYGPVTVSRTSGTHNPVTLVGAPNPSIDAVWKVESVISRTDTQAVTIKWAKGYQGYNSLFDSAQVWESNNAQTWTGFGYAQHATTRSITINTPLTYAFTVTDNPLAHPLAINAIQEKQMLSLYPNPAVNNVKVMGTLSADASITVTDVLGRKVLEANGNEFSTNNLNPGLYHVLVMDGKTQSLLKLVKE